MNTIKRLFILCLLISTSTALFAFHPIRFSPLDLYVVRPSIGGPLSLSVTDKKGKVSKTGKLYYDTSGKLVKEVYFDKQGKKEGESRLTYKNDLLTQERLLDSKGKVLVRRDFEYTKKNLVKMKIYNKGGQSQMEQVYRYRNNILTNGQENNGTGLLTFDISYTKNLATSIKIRSANKKIISMIYLKYNKHGQVIQRIRSQDGQKHQFMYYYKNKKIDNYVLSHFTNKKWTILKTTRFVY